LAKTAAPATDHTGVRSYSVHRAYGQTPDAVPLGAQFFASASPDLAAPPALPPQRVTTSTGRVELVAPDAAGPDN
jgi:hypothetical protein